MILSRGQDTNGQNYRFKQAAEKHGSDEKVLTALAVGKDDPAAVVTRYRLAAEKYGTLKIREAHRHHHYFDWPHDITWGRNVCTLHPNNACAMTDRQLKELAQEADVIHLNNSEVAYQQFHLKKPALLHHHGTSFRGNPQKMLATARSLRFVQAVSTIDLLRFAPEVLTWLPSAYDIDALRDYGKTHARKPDGRILIGHFPTSRETKGTDAFIAAVKELRAEGLPVDVTPAQFLDPKLDPKWVPTWTWAKTMAEKSKCDIVFDQLTWGYGCNGIEAWAMGKPVVAGADDWTLAEMDRQWDGLPFALSDEKSLKATLRLMVTDPGYREHWADIGYQHVRTYHDELPALTKLAELYEDAIATYHRPRIAGKGPSVTFTKKKGGSVYDLDGEPIPFVNGRYTTNDPMTVQRLRTLAKRSQRFGISEDTEGVA